MVKLTTKIRKQQQVPLTKLQLAEMILDRNRMQEYLEQEMPVSTRDGNVIVITPIIPSGDPSPCPGPEERIQEVVDTPRRSAYGQLEEYDGERNQGQSDGTPENHPDESGDTSTGVQ